MNSIHLNEKWNLIKPSDTVKILRIDSLCKPDLSIGIDQYGKRCLSLKSRNINEDYLEGGEFSNLSIIFLPSEDRVIIRVLEEYFWDLFNDFVISIYHKIYQIEDDATCVKEFFRTFNRWVYFFDEKRGSKISEEVLVGIFGELIFIDYLLSQPALSFKLSDIEKSWVGPYDKGHDFEFMDIDFEIKTKPPRSLDVHIASEFQLQEDVGKQLELVVVDIEKDYMEGKTIKDIISVLKDKIITLGGDVSFIVEGLKQKNINFSELDDYENFRFKSHRITFYDCLAEGFPKIQRALLDQSIRKVRYQIRLSNLTEYIKLEQSL